MCGRKSTCSCSNCTCLDINFATTRPRCLDQVPNRADEGRKSSRHLASFASLVCSFGHLSCCCKCCNTEQTDEHRVKANRLLHEGEVAVQRYLTFASTGSCQNKHAKARRKSQAANVTLLHLAWVFAVGEATDKSRMKAPDCHRLWRCCHSTGAPFQLGQCRRGS